MLKRFLKSISPKSLIFSIIGLTVAMVVVSLWYIPSWFAAGPQGSQVELPYYKFERMVFESQIKEETVIVNRSIVLLTETDILFEKKGESIKYWTAVPLLKNSPYEYMKMSGLNPWQKTEYPWGYIFFAAPAVSANIILFALFIFLLYDQRKQVDELRGMGKSPARRVTSREVTFKDVAGVDEAKAILQEIVEQLRNPGIFREFGAKAERGVLLNGPPGCGKTLLARAVAGEASVPFFEISASEFEGFLVGAGAAKVRDTFEEAKRHGRAIVFIDEIEIVGRKRGEAGISKHASQEQTTAQIFTLMDGVNTGKEEIVVIAATNRIELIDEALLRPGRFSRQVYLGPPDRKGREAILAVHVRGKPLSKDVDLGKISQLIPGFTGAHIADLTNLAAKRAVKKFRLAAVLPIKKEITMDDFRGAISEALMGPARDLDLSLKEKKILAVHEVGHATVARMMPSAPAVKSLIIAPHEKALGYTWFPPQKERYLEFISEIKEKLAVILAGRVAEKVVFGGDFTMGSVNDLQKATSIARQLIFNVAISEERLGPQFFNAEGDAFLSPANRAHLERRVGELLKTAACAAQKVLENEQVRKAFDELQEELLKNKELDDEQAIEEIFKKHIAGLPEK